MLPVQHAVCVYCNSQILGIRTLHFKTVPCSLKQKTRSREERAQGLLFGALPLQASSPPSRPLWILKLRPSLNGSMCQCPIYLVSGYSAWLVTSPLSPPISLLGPPLWLPLEESLDRKHLNKKCFVKEIFIYRVCHDLPENVDVKGIIAEASYPVIIWRTQVNHLSGLNNFSFLTNSQKINGLHNPSHDLRAWNSSLYRLCGWLWGWEKTEPRYDKRGTPG